MDSIAKNPRWLGAQVPFAELSDKVRANPLDGFRGHAVFKKLKHHVQAPENSQVSPDV
jgi:hypothetical protein